MRELDRDYAEELMRRLKTLGPETRPRWGSLTPETLVRHLVWTMLHSMDRSHKVPFFGNWFTRRLVGPVVLSGWIPIPQNLRLPGHLAAQGIEALEPGGLDTLAALLDEYLALVQSGELKTGLHPVFGDIGIDGWARVHVLHFEHHCRQFGL